MSNSYDLYKKTIIDSYKKGEKEAFNKLSPALRVSLMLQMEKEEKQQKQTKANEELEKKLAGGNDQDRQQGKGE